MSAVASPGTAGERLAAAGAMLAAAGLATARLEAEWLLAGVLGVGRFDVYLHDARALSDAEDRAFTAAVARRAAGEPLQQIVGWESFCGLRVRVTRDVLVPRPETESLVDWALELLGPGRALVVDVGTGSGCIAVALARARPGVTVLATDVSVAAARIAADNARALGVAGRVRVVVGDVLDAVGAGRVDLVVANPPYMAEGLLPGLPREVRDWEPPLALLAGADGLAVLARVVDDARRVLRPGGALVVETAGEAHVDAVAARCRAAGYEAVAIRGDLTRQRRFVAARRGRD